MSRRWGFRRLGRGGRREQPEGQCLGRFASAFCGVLLPTALSRIRIIERTRLITTTVVSGLAAGGCCCPGHPYHPYQLKYVARRLAWSVAHPVHFVRYLPPVPRYRARRKMPTCYRQPNGPGCGERQPLLKFLICWVVAARSKDRSVALAGYSVRICLRGCPRGP